MFFKEKERKRKELLTPNTVSHKNILLEWRRLIFLDKEKQKHLLLEDLPHKTRWPRMVLRFFFTLGYCESDIHSAETVLQNLNFDFFSQTSNMQCDTPLWRWGSTSPSQPCHHKGKLLILYSVLCCQHFWISCLVFSHPIMSTKHPSVPPASGEKRKAITLEKKLKIIT